MRRLIALAVVAVVAGSAAALAATDGWRVIGKGSASGDYATASVSASVDKPGAVAFRMSSDNAADVTWSIACSGTTKRAAVARIYVLTPSAAADCHVRALASGEGKTALQLLVRRR
jgi:hypothetical protein